MNSFFLFSLFYLVNFVFKIKADDSSIKINMNCNENEKEYYNSIYNNCQRCTIKVYNNICYSNQKSIYGLPIKNSDGDCPDGQFITELDEEGKHLGRLMCTKIKQEYPNNKNYERMRINFNTFQDIKRPEIGFAPKSFTLGEFNSTEINYSIDACFLGLYEKSCQYLANLCVLMMYKEDNNFIYCTKIFQFEKDNNM